MKGVIRTVLPRISELKLHVDAELETEEGERIVAELPQREVAALLPRKILVGDGNTASYATLETIRETLSRLAGNREVRFWEYKDRTYCSFLSWRNVKFADAAETENREKLPHERRVPALHGNAESD